MTVVEATGCGDQRRNIHPNYDTANDAVPPLRMRITVQGRVYKILSFVIQKVILKNIFQLRFPVKA